MIKPLTEIEIAIGDPFKFNQHPDGMPWQKCCKGNSDDKYQCQCFMRKPEKAQSRHDESINLNGTSNYHSVDQLKAEDGRFYCCHRTTSDGFHRECAGWAAKMHKKP